MPPIARAATLLALLGALIGASLTPAQAAPLGQVQLVSFIEKGFSRSSNTASLRFSWPKVRAAKKYEIYLSKSYSMSSARKFRTSKRSKTIKGLAPGTDYFVQVRAVRDKKVGAKSARVGTTTIRQFPTVRGEQYRLMTYNTCSRVCSSQKGREWEKREAAAHDRVRAYKPDVVFAQESDHFHASPGYTQAHYKSAKRLTYKTARFTMDEGLKTPVVYEPISSKCDPTRSWGTHGEISLGRHDGGCRWAVWAILTDRHTGERSMFVNVHLVSGSSKTRALDRRAEMRELMAHVDEANVDNLRTVFGGDFNSHRNRSRDYPRHIFNEAGYYDAYESATVLKRQHHSSYNNFKTTPVISYKWGDHIDKLWARPDEARILAWYNAEALKGGKLRTPIGSDHSPIVIDLRFR
jgi:endonuclease/exonuclease/phosphatase family metal-dependent hydrolase